ncbi:MAG: glycosyltransferase family A protein, partial [Patescibacteria group bacterium]|nr:glycosyltransferase family A protein [Patescibacteria group bacterium]
MPETSIIIRTFNEEKHVGNLLKAIREQDYKDYEIILVDSGSTDRTLEIAKKFGHKILEIESQDFTFGYSLNVGC